MCKSVISAKHLWACACFVYITVYAAVSANFHSNECDYAQCVCDSSNKLMIIATVMPHLACKFNPSTNKCTMWCRCVLSVIKLLVHVKSYSCMHA